VYYEVPQHAKPEALARILDLEEPDSAIIFVRTRRDVDELSERLNGLGYLAQGIHGEINQAQRERALERFRNGHTQLLVATDVAARGLDIPDVSHIINYDLPLDADAYVHRIGRTGRAGATGEALTLVTPRERRLLMQIERAVHRRLERLRLPTPADVAVRRRAAFREDVLKILDDGQLDPFLRLVEDLADTHDAAELAAAAFKMAAQAREARRPGHGESWIALPAQAGAVEQAPYEPEAVAGEPLVGTGRGAGPPRNDSEGPLRGTPRVASPGTPAGKKARRERREPQAMARLFLRVGKRDGVRPSDIVGAIANEAAVPGDTIGDIDLYDTFSFVEVPEDLARPVVAALNQTTIRGRPPRATLARPMDAWHEQDADGRRGDSDGRGRAPRREREDDGRRPPRAPFAPRRGAGRVFGASRPARGDKRFGKKR
jgi:ATP-dependent RNA helicase DeaD